MIKTEDFDKVQVNSAAELRSWLLKHHQQAQSVWLVTYKKSIPDKYVSTSEVLDELLCFGWIDGIRRKLDGDRTMQLISPRKVQHWSKTYKDRVAKLTAEGRMHGAGIEAIRQSKKNGLWSFMDDVDNLVVPADLKSALQKYQGAQEFFQGINDSSKRFVLRWIKIAKTSDTRRKRIEKIAILSSRGEKLKGS